MTDLFGQDARETCGEARKKGSAHLGTPIVNLRNRGAAGSRGKTAETCVPQVDHRVPRGSGREPAEYVTQLVERRRQLLTTLNELDQELYELQPAYDRLKSEFYAAHQALAWEWADQDHSEAAREKRRPLYDARLSAGVAWRPVRKQYDDLQAIRKGMAVELRRINEELEQR